MYHTNEVPRPAWIEVDLKAIKNNICEIRRLVADEAEIMAVVKANAYGHGMERIAFTVLENGADRLGVATLGEGVALRKAGIVAPILVLGFVTPEQAQIAIRYNIAQTVYSLAAAQAISQKAIERGKRATIHIKIDTGMGRIGFLPMAPSVEEICQIAELPGLYMEGVYTHFAVADEADKSFTIKQHDIFLDMINKLARRGIHFDICHAANSAALIDMPETRFDMVRPGIIMYGHYPSNAVNHEKLSLQPALALKALVSHVKEVPPGSSIGYGRTFIASESRVIASLPLGYADGYPRSLSNRGCVLLHGQRVPVVGSVCMDQLMVDVTALENVQVGDEAVVLGSQGADRISLEEFAASNNTINYEILCMLSERLPRLYLE